jgi:hypothetical protein
LPLDNFEVPITLSSAPGRQLLTTIRCISPDLFETREQWGEPSKQTPGTFSIVQIGGGHVHSQEQTECIHEDMAFASFHMFVRIEATDPGRFLNRFDALCIDDRCARLDISPDSLTFGFPENREQSKPRAFEA